MNTRISVIIPIYNTKPYLQEAIDSILEQKEYLYEIIIINDGSDDGSGDFLETLYGKNEIVKIRHTKNNGQGHARNLGTNLAKGNYIYYFDSDDIIVSNLFEKFHNLLSKVPELELFCFSGESFLDPIISIEDISRPSELSKKAFKRKINVDCNSGEEAFKLLVDNNSFIPVPWLYIFKRSILSQNEIEFRPIKYEDEEFTHKLFIYAGYTNITNDIFFLRRVRAGSTMQLTRTFNDLLGYFKTIESLFELKNLKTIKPETKFVLESRIVTFTKLIIEIKATSKINFSKEEKKIYSKKLISLIKRNANLFIYSFRFPLEYKLRTIKKHILN